MPQTKIAVIGDVHGCLTELEALWSSLRTMGVGEIFHVGDLVDKGPDSAGVVRFCREQGLRGVLGNHESALLDRLKKINRYNLSDLDVAYLKSLPLIHVLDDYKALIVHAGLWPGLALWQQPRSVLYARMIHPDRPGDVRWWGRGTDGVGEEDARAQGYRRWYEVCDEDALVIYGHSVAAEPRRFARTLGLDTGCVYGGSLSAVILPGEDIVSVSALRAYAERLTDEDGNILD